MAHTELDVNYVAHLARLSLSPEEARIFSAQLGNILDYVGKLAELDVGSVEPTAHAVPMSDIARPDEVRASLPHEEAMQNAPAKAGGLFVVPKIVE